MNGIEKYFKYRQSLIDQYVKGDMTKREYLQANYDAVVYNDIKPFKNMDTVQKGLFNYQYYNARAKEKKQASTIHDIDYYEKTEYLNSCDYFYSKKDKATMRVLKLLDYKGVEAYFVKVHSKELNGKLFEIILADYNMILHSTNELILNNLKEEGILGEGSRMSVIDGYINQRY
ncbi:hypothetical protein SDC9_90072 [bioreactor metagenome]|uniref:Uncharacterized protein n=1 Tax=bioreactor metagenome TaxID=1076179 RepID=A0A644ZQY5_9ZZZZ|nr:DUF6648 family protein [Bacteroidaceae bacterium]MEA4972034.1 DUF6648 family protein [Candidatus Metalachnospira sp.]